MCNHEAAAEEVHGYEDQEKNKLIAVLAQVGSMLYSLHFNTSGTDGARTSAEAGSEAQESSSQSDYGLNEDEYNLEDESDNEGQLSEEAEEATCEEEEEEDDDEQGGNKEGNQKASTSQEETEGSPDFADMPERQMGEASTSGARCWQGPSSRISRDFGTSWASKRQEQGSDLAGRLLIYTWTW